MYYLFVDLFITHLFAAASGCDTVVVQNQA